MGPAAVAKWSPPEHPSAAPASNTSLGRRRRGATPSLPPRSQRRVSCCRLDGSGALLVMVSAALPLVFWSRLEIQVDRPEGGECSRVGQRAREKSSSNQELTAAVGTVPSPNVRQNRPSGNMTPYHRYSYQWGAWGRPVPAGGDRMKHQCNSNERFESETGIIRRVLEEQIVPVMADR